MPSAVCRIFVFLPIYNIPGIFKCEAHEKMSKYYDKAKEAVTPPGFTFMCHLVKLTESLAHSGLTENGPFKYYQLYLQMASARKTL